MNKMIQGLSLCDWLVSLSTVSSRITHVKAGENLLPVWDWEISHCMGAFCLSAHLLIVLCCFQFWLLWIMLLWIWVHKCLQFFYVYKSKELKNPRKCTWQYSVKGRFQTNPQQYRKIGNELMDSRNPYSCLQFFYVYTQKRDCWIRE